MLKKLFDIAEIKASPKKEDVKEGGILVSRTGKKIVKLNTENITEYQDKDTYILISASSEYLEPIYDSLSSKEFETWITEHAKGSAMPLITVVDLKDFEINI